MATDFMLVDTKAEQDIIDYMSKQTRTQYSDEQLNILKTHGGMCILASAGSGKTTTLNHLIAKRIQTGEIADPSKLLCTTYSKSGATEMGQRLDQLLSQLGIHKKASIRTLHSVYLGLLRDLQYNVNVIDGGTKMGLLRQACSEMKVSLEDDELTTLDSILSYQVNNLMSDSDIFMSYIYTLREKIDQETYSKIRSLFNSKKQEKGYIDFDDMQLLLYQIFRSDTYGKAMENYVHSLYEYIYIDEAQDISKIQFAILKKMVSDPSKLVIIGDDDQCIYQWRGADPSIILNICGIYPELTRVTLTTNYRCLGNIVDRAAVGIKFNQIRSDKSMVAHAPGGDIKLCDTGNGNIYEMSKYAFSYIYDLVINQGVNPSEIAVLARNNQHLSILGNMLFREGIFCSAGDDIKLTKNQAYKHTSGVFDLAENTFSSKVTSSELLKYCKYLGKKRASVIANVQSTYGLSLKDTLGFLINEFSLAHVEWTNPGIKYGALDAGKLDSFMKIMSDDVVHGLIDIYNLLAIGEPGEIACGLYNKYLDCNLGFKYKKAHSKRFIEGYIQYMTTLIKELGYTQFKRYIKGVEQFESGKMAIMSPMVTLSTMHGAKGKEWRYVVLFAVDNVTFPNFEDIDSNIALGIPELDIRCMIDEDRRLHYVAMTRAKEHLTIFAPKDNLSIYTMESFGIVDPALDSNKHIMMMAQHGIYSDLIDSASKLFEEGADTRLEVNLGIANGVTKGNVLGAPEAEPKQKPDTGFNLNSIQTYAPINFNE